MESEKISLNNNELIPHRVILLSIRVVCECVIFISLSIQTLFNSEIKVTYICIIIASRLCN